MSNVVYNIVVKFADCWDTIFFVIKKFVFCR